jgi:hypothetical protein
MRFEKATEQATRVLTEQGAARLARAAEEYRQAAGLCERCQRHSADDVVDITTDPIALCRECAAKHRERKQNEALDRRFAELKREREELSRRGR